jgi:hypothetical protein
MGDVGVYFDKMSDGRRRGSKIAVARHFDLIE